MPLRESPSDAADRAHEALRQLAHGTRTVEDPLVLYSILGSLTRAVSSLSQSLHQLAEVHDDHGARQANWTPAQTRADRAAGYQVSWELHRAGEMLRQVGAAIDHAHEVESTITYQHPEPHPTAAPARTAVHRIEL